MNPLPKNYIIPGPNKVGIISHQQTLSLIMGSCISTVLIGRNAKSFFLAANHIVIAQPGPHSIAATKNADEQIDEIITLMQKESIDKDDLCCFHLIGGGQKSRRENFTVPEKNIHYSIQSLGARNIPILFCDTGSHFFATYSLYNNNLSVFIEDRLQNIHISFALNLAVLFDNLPILKTALPGIPLQSADLLFETLIEKNIIFFVTGEKLRNIHQEKLNSTL
jgi:chemotaxis receptor (MCP) glutamine deamidase CheD